ncbi:MAG: hypothetical protein RBR28_09275 [Lentimicrobium sp.]|jgi:hypothetical protein|nr:hypothetical protein [Lentimicrobium sp.]
MENKKVIKSLGFVIKKEKLASLATEHKFSELILEDLDPYPGFYDHYHIPVKEEEQKPRSIFAVIKTRGLDEMDDFIRITRYIKKTTDYTFDAVMGWLELQNSVSGCIRINMNDYGDLPAIIGLYSKYGIEFLANRTVRPFISLITVRKYMIIEEMEPGIYRDTDMADIYYFEVERYLPRARFESISDSIRNNWEHKVYDAAQAGVYSREGVVELIRIYDQTTSMENLRYLKEKYQIEISRAQ